MSPNPVNPDMEGEGNKSADKRYRDEATDFAHSGRVEQGAHDAERALEEEGEELERASQAARRRSAGDIEEDLGGE